MQAQQVDILKRTVTQFDGQRFFQRLRDADPVAFAQFFAGRDMYVLQRKVALALNTVVTKVDKLEPFQDQLRDLGLLHASFGVESEHYELARQAMLQSLNLKRSEEFVAWDSAIRLISATMQGLTQELPSLDVHLEHEPASPGPASDSE